jgi:hypothetical protein
MVISGHQCQIDLWAQNYLMGMLEPCPMFFQIPSTEIRFPPPNIGLLWNTMGLFAQDQRQICEFLGEHRCPSFLLSQISQHITALPPPPQLSRETNSAGSRQSKGLAALRL